MTNKKESNTNDKRLLKLLFQEEWRLHRELFDGNRFLAFPLIIAGLVALASIAISLDFMGALNPSSLLLGVQVFVFLFGLQTGSIIFMSNRDNIENLLGDITPFIYTAKITPTPVKRFVQLFILKDVVYYSILILIPLGIGLYPSFGLEIVPIIFSFIGLFILGIGVTTVSASLYYNHGSIGLVLMLFSLVLVLGIGKSLLGSFFGLTPAGMFYSQSYPVIGTVIGWAIALISPVLGSLFFKSHQSRTQTVYEENIFKNDWPVSSLTKKQIIDVKRSSGGFGKVIFSYLVILGLAVGMLQFIEPLETYISHTMFLSIVLSMGAFTTYTWINQADSIEEYLILPITLDDIIESKFYLFSVLTIIPISIIVAGATFITQNWLMGVLSIFIAVGLTVYCYSVTVAFAGFSPHEFLFDSARFIGFSLAISLPIIPLLVISLFFPPTFYMWLYGGVLVYVSMLAVIGYLVMKRTPDIWRRTLNITA